MNYLKPPLGINDLIHLIEGRGCLIDDRVALEQALRIIGYYRLSGYFCPFKNHGTEEFVTGILSSGVLKAYDFDIKLRNILFKALGYIEIYTKTILTDVMSLHQDNQSQGLWYSEGKFYAPKQKPKKFFIEIEDNLNKELKQYFNNGHYYKTLIAKNFSQKYTSKPPSWIAFELLTFGVIAKLYAKLMTCYQNDISQKFGIRRKELISWLFSASELRNKSAHHERLWHSKNFHYPPVLHRSWTCFQSKSHAKGLHARILMIHDMLKCISSEYAIEFRKEIEVLIKNVDDFILKGTDCPKNNIF